METEERLSRLEQRVEVIEELARSAQARLDAFAKSPAAKKLAAMFGVNLA